MIDLRVLGAQLEQALDPTMQLATVAARVGQPIDMIDTQPVDQALGDQLEYLPVGGLEHLWPLDTQAAQLVDVEEAPPVDVIAGGAPAGQAVVLTLQQLVQTLKAFRLAGIEMRENLLDTLEHLRVLGQFGQLGPGLACALISLRKLRQCSEALSHFLQLRVIHGLQQRVVGQRADRKVMLIVLDVERALLGIEAQRDFAGLQYRAVVAAQEWQQQLTF